MPVQYRLNESIQVIILVSACFVLAGHGVFYRTNHLEENKPTASNICFEWSELVVHCDLSHCNQNAHYDLSHWFMFPTYKIHGLPSLDRPSGKYPTIVFCESPTL